MTKHRWGLLNHSHIILWTSSRIIVNCKLKPWFGFQSKAMRKTLRKSLGVKTDLRAEFIKLFKRFAFSEGNHFLSSENAKSINQASQRSDKILDFSKTFTYQVDVSVNETQFLNMGHLLLDEVIQFLAVVGEQLGFLGRALEQGLHLDHQFLQSHILLPAGKTRESDKRKKIKNKFEEDSLNLLNNGQLLHYLFSLVVPRNRSHLNISDEKLMRKQSGNQWGLSVWSPNDWRLYT